MTMRMAISGTEAFDLDQLLELDMEVHHNEASIPIASLSTMADSLPGLGIVVDASYLPDKICAMPKRE